MIRAFWMWPTDFSKWKMAVYCLLFSKMVEIESDINGWPSAET
jgi:hypothetical protein